mmetsp:Transcript_17790/g.43779  ORF Transcript_17790/g.43779 Transcript_17790/m.43779 type:complete len:212 (+) Transcript_17790:68-703(+)
MSSAAYALAAHVASTATVRFADPLLYAAAFFIFLNPFMWNVVSRREHRTRFLTRFFGGNKYAACYFCAACIFSAGLWRDYVFSLAVESQPTSAALGCDACRAFGWLLTAFGATLVVSSSLRLGITGTFIGDYCGILMDAPITAFPFNVFANPMYVGSTSLFAAHAVLHQSPAGLLLAAWVWVVYYVACLYENPFTAQIYAEHAARVARRRQ